MGNVADLAESDPYKRGVEAAEKARLLGIAEIEAMLPDIDPREEIALHAAATHALARLRSKGES